MSRMCNKIPNYAAVAGVMESKGVPSPRRPRTGDRLLDPRRTHGAGRLLGRIGALLLAVFLVLATYYFHPFWTDVKDEPMMIDFMKNLGLFGAMLFIIANGSAAGSLDNRRTTT